jgi:DNA-binding transcriptional ArsR family regulator
LNDPVGSVFSALADPTRRRIVEAMVREGSTSVPELTSELPISRQAVAKHLASLADAGLVERTRGRGREIRYRPELDALGPAASWLRTTRADWDERLASLKEAVEGGARTSVPARTRRASGASR